MNGYLHLNASFLQSLLFAVVISLFNGIAYAVHVPDALVETQWLEDNLSQVVVLDVRSDLKSFTSKPEFIKDKKTGKQRIAKIGGHIPGASLVNFKEVRADRKVGKKIFKNMLPEKSAFEKLLQIAGVNKNSSIVITSKGASSSDVLMATRLYWQLKYYGHKDLAILNGGMAQWLLDNRKVSTISKPPIQGDWVASTERDELLATSEEVVEASLQTKADQLIDVRPIGQYLGTHKSSSVSAFGHISAARNFPTELLFTDELPIKVTSKQQAVQLVNALNIKIEEDKIVYCNTGKMASGGWFFFSEVLGY
ncbi:MAG: rhodanese-like domain-containing protein, partial [Gammaproteobacteria bacterium]|nr:rhodanese-like domain-containing protein [Gammaproteobacteria bacterium]